MAIDFAADAAAIFSAGDVTVAATYLPAVGAPLEIQVLPQLDDVDVRSFDARLVVDRAIFLVLVADVASPTTGDLISVDGAYFAVQGDPVRNARRIWWAVEAVPQ